MRERQRENKDLEKKLTSGFRDLFLYKKWTVLIWTRLRNIILTGLDLEKWTNHSSVSAEFMPGTIAGLYLLNHLMGFHGGSTVKNPPANAGDVGLIPGLEGSPGGGLGKPVEYSCLEIP